MIKVDTLASPNFDSIPVNEILKSAPTRSAFIQSLQKSREREERREQEREKEVNGVSGINGINCNSYDKGYEYDRNNFNSISTDYLEPKSLNKTDDFNNLQQLNKLSQSPITPTLNRRRISNSSVSNNNNNLSSSTFKHLNNSTPTNQSKLAVHAFTMSRSSNDDENESSNNARSNERINERSSNRSRESYGGLSCEYIDSKSNNYNNSIKFTSTPQRSTINAFPINSEDSDFKRRYEEQFFSKTTNNNTNTIDNVNNTINTSSDYQKDISTLNSQNNKQVQMQLQNSIDPSQSLNYEIVKNLIDTTLESHTISLKNDLQNLHVEIIKQSLIQQNSLQRLLETYLPMTGKLMESLEETRDENLKLKKRIDELTFSRR